MKKTSKANKDANNDVMKRKAQQQLNINQFYAQVLSSLPFKPSDEYERGGAYSAVFNMNGKTFSITIMDETGMNEPTP